MMARWSGVVAVLAAAVVALAGIGTNAQGDSGDGDLGEAVAGLEQRVAALEARLGGAPLGTPEPGGRRFAGEGDVVSAPFPLRRGVLIARIEAAGEGEVAVTLFDREGERLAFGAKDLPYAGTLAERIPTDGEYLLAVESDGEWKVSLGQP